jgi:hypothetical protein
MSVKSSTELMLYVVLTMPTLNKAYLFIYLFIMSALTSFSLLLLRKKDKQRSTTHTHEAKDRVSLKTRGELSLP